MHFRKTKANVLKKRIAYCNSDMTGNESISIHWIRLQCADEEVGHMAVDTNLKFILTESKSLGPHWMLKISKLPFKTWKNFEGFKQLQFKS